MLKTSLITEADLVESRKLERRRQFEDDRKNRIFNARQRLFGVDLDALHRQKNEKIRMKSAREECQRNWDKEIVRQQLSVQEHEIEEEKRKKEAILELNEYRCKYQRADQRREYDLNDPDLIKKQKPARVADIDPNLGISSAQVFTGEDVGNAERRARQRAQQRSWLEQQMAERRAAEAARAKADDIMLGAMLDREARLDFMAENINRVRGETIDSITQYNAELAEEKRMLRVQEKKERWEDDLAEIYNMLTSDMLSENPDVAQSCTNPNKKVAYMYRGMSPAELKVFYAEQQDQIAEMKKRRIDEQMRGKLWEQMTMNMDRELKLKELELDRKRCSEVDVFLEENGKLAAEQRKQRELEEFNKRNIITDDFYNQFNKNSR